LVVYTAPAPEQIGNFHAYPVSSQGQMT
jgi:hypothetical protein